MRFVRHLDLLVACALFFCPITTRATDAQPQKQSSGRAQHKLRVAVFERPPYTFKTDQGIWTGIGIELWEQIAEELHLPYEYVEVPLIDVYEALHSGKCDLTPAVSLTHNAIDLVDYTSPYLFSYAAVQTVQKSLRQQLESFYLHLWESGIVAILLSMMGLMIIFSAVLMIFERKNKEGHFGGSHLKGFGTAFWFSAVTMTSVGYGDTKHLTPFGRSITFLWMLLGILFVALFTGAVVSAISSSNESAKVFHIDDLARFKTGAYQGSIMDLALRDRGIPVTEYTTPELGIAALDGGEITAFAGDAIPMTYIATNHYPGRFTLSLITSKSLFYVMATRPELPEFQRINKKLLNITLLPNWRSRVERWTGPIAF
jgi:ABC-type amino acid transport substrate-binding protein